MNAMQLLDLELMSSANPLYLDLVDTALQVATQRNVSDPPPRPLVGEPSSLG